MLQTENNHIITSIPKTAEEILLEIIKVNDKKIEELTLEVGRLRGKLGK